MPGLVLPTRTPICPKLFFEHWLKQSAHANPIFDYHHERLGLKRAHAWVGAC
jgi:hypothetical protein